MHSQSENLDSESEEDDDDDDILIKPEDLIVSCHSSVNFDL